MSDDSTLSAQPPKRTHRKVGKVESEERTMLIFTKIIEGSASAKILDFCMREWQITKAQAYTYYNRARALMEIENKATREQLLIEHRLHRRNLRERAKKVGDLRTELDAGKDEAKLSGLYPGDKTAMNFDNATTDELMSRLSQLLGIPHDSK